MGSENYEDPESDTKKISDGFAKAQHNGGKKRKVAKKRKVSKRKSKQSQKLASAKVSKRKSKQAQK